MYGDLSNLVGIIYTEFSCYASHHFRDCVIYHYQDRKPELDIFLAYVEPGHVTVIPATYELGSQVGTSIL